MTPRDHHEERVRLLAGPYVMQSAEYWRAYLEECRRIIAFEAADADRGQR